MLLGTLHDARTGRGSAGRDAGRDAPGVIGVRAQPDVDAEVLITLDLRVVVAWRRSGLRGWGVSGVGWARSGAAPADPCGAAKRWDCPLQTPPHAPVGVAAWHAAACQPIAWGVANTHVLWCRQAGNCSKRCGAYLLFFTENLMVELAVKSVAILIDFVFELFGCRAVHEVPFHDAPCFQCPVFVFVHTRTLAGGLLSIHHIERRDAGTITANGSVLAVSQLKAIRVQHK